MCEADFAPDYGPARDKRESKYSATHPDDGDCLSSRDVDLPPGRIEDRCEKHREQDYHEPRGNQQLPGSLAQAILRRGRDALTQHSLEGQETWLLSNDLIDSFEDHNALQRHRSGAEDQCAPSQPIHARESVTEWSPAQLVARAVLGLNKPPAPVLRGLTLRFGDPIDQELPHLGNRRRGDLSKQRLGVHPDSEGYPVRDRKANH